MVDMHRQWCCDWLPDQQWTALISLVTMLSHNPLLCCCYHLAGNGRSVARLWPQLTARLQRSAGGMMLCIRSWSTHLLRGRPGQRRHWLLGDWPSDRLMWQLSALWAGTSSGRLATWSKKALQRTWLIVSEMDWRPVVVEMSSFRMNWCHLLLQLK